MSKMEDRLDSLVERYNEINELMMSSSVVSDRKQMAKLGREQNELTPIVETYAEYKQAKEEFEEVQNFCMEVGLPVTLEEIGVTTVEQVETIAKNACVPGETIHNLAGDVQPIELYDAILQADAMGKLALGK